MYSYQPMLQARLILAICLISLAVWMGPPDWMGGTACPVLSCLSAVTASFLRCFLGGFTMDTTMMATMKKWPRKCTEFQVLKDRSKSSSCKPCRHDRQVK